MKTAIRTHHGLNALTTGIGSVLLALKSLNIASMGLVIVMLASILPTAIADVRVNISVKVIKKPDGTRPIGGMADAAGFGGEVTHGNQVLNATGRGYQLVVVEFLDIQPAVPNGEAADYWFSLPARGNRQIFEDAAVADPTTWRWNPNAINFYVNDSGSGQCSFPGTGGTISLGKTIFATGTVIHEIGHFFNLRHTHLGDNNRIVGEWGDGDGLPDTLPDDPDASAADITARHPAETQQRRDDLFFNVMSYHREDRLLPAQMDVWTIAALGPRLGFLSRRTWFVANGGSDAASGDNPGSPFATLSRALTSARTSVGPLDDDISLSSGTYTAPAGNVINTACTLRATGGAVRIIRP